MCEVPHLSCQQPASSLACPQQAPSILTLDMGMDANAQQASASLWLVSPKTGMGSSVWKVSHTMPDGAVIQYLFDFACVTCCVKSRINEELIAGEKTYARMV